MLYPAFQPVTLAISGPQGLFTHPRSGLPAAQAFAAAAKANPGRLNVGVPGLGSSQHLTSELLLRAAGDLRVTHVPYRGGGPLLQDLIAGNIDAGMTRGGQSPERLCTDRVGQSLRMRKEPALLPGRDGLE